MPADAAVFVDAGSRDRQRCRVDDSASLAAGTLNRAAPAVPRSTEGSLSSAQRGQVVAFTACHDRMCHVGISIAHRAIWAISAPLLPTNEPRVLFSGHVQESAESCCRVSPVPATIPVLTYFATPPPAGERDRPLLVRAMVLWSPDLALTRTLMMNSRLTRELAKALSSAMLGSVLLTAPVLLLEMIFIGTTHFAYQPAALVGGISGLCCRWYVCRNKRRT